MGGRTTHVKQGIWIDHDLPGWRSYQVLFTPETAQIVVNAIAVALTLTLPRLWVFAKLLIPKESKSTHAGGKTHNGESTRTSSHLELENVPGRGSSNPRPLTDPEGAGGRVQRVDEDEPDQPLPHARGPRKPASAHISVFNTSRITSDLLHTFREAESIEDAAAQLASSHLAMGTPALTNNPQAEKTLRERISDVIRNFRQDTWSFALISGLVLMLFALFIGEQIVAISVAGIISGSTAVSSSPRCGNWQFVGHNLTGPQSSLYEYRTEGAAKERAVAYIDSCYGQGIVAESCNPYYNRTISYSEEHNATCPFFGEVCLYGETSAYALDTGYVDSTVLGINTPKRYQFRRRTVCSPIVTNSSYVAYYYNQNDTSMAPMVVYYYQAGWVQDIMQPSDFSYAQLNYGFSNGYYHMHIHGSTLHAANESRSWLRDEFRPPLTDVSILLIRPKALLYAERSDDPIFPALNLAGNNESYQNSLTHATALACADTATICDQSTNQTWIPRNLTWWQHPTPEWHTLPMKNVFYLTAAALDRSNTWSAIKYSSILLDAERKIATTSGTSLPLAREQWKVESKRFFETSLALAQGRVNDIARGTEADEPGVLDVLEDEHSEVCGMIKIPTQGWTNVGLVWLVSLPGFAFLMWFLSVEVGGKIVLVLGYRHGVVPAVRGLHERVLVPLLQGCWKVGVGFGRAWRDPGGCWRQLVCPGGLVARVRRVAAVRAGSASRRRRRPEDGDDDEAPGAVRL